MNVRNDVDTLTQVLASQPAQSVLPGRTTPSAPKENTDTAEVSAVGTQVVQSAGDADVRLDKVAGIQAALQAGTYQIPASAVAQKLIAALLSPEK